MSSDEGEQSTFTGCRGLRDDNGVERRSPFTYRWTLQSPVRRYIHKRGIVGNVAASNMVASSAALERV